MFFFWLQRRQAKKSSLDIVRVKIFLSLSRPHRIYTFNFKNQTNNKKHKNQKKQKKLKKKSEYLRKID